MRLLAFLVLLYYIVFLIPFIVKGKEEETPNNILYNPNSRLAYIIAYSSFCK